jgi:hypothetical protein
MNLECFLEDVVDGHNKETNSQIESKPRMTKMTKIANIDD